VIVVGSAVFNKTDTPTANLTQLRKAVDEAR